MFEADIINDGATVFVLDLETENAETDVITHDADVSLAVSKGTGSGIVREPARAWPAGANWAMPKS